MISSPNRRILLIDDMPSIHDDFRKLMSTPAPSSNLDEDEALLFGEPTAAAAPHEAGFDMDSAYQGQEGLDRVRQALAQGRPYAMAFVDMRMPPGWDGVQTIEQLWQADPQLQIVICTAYTEHSWEAVLDRLDTRDRLLVLKKPFDAIEVLQLARTLATKWDLNVQAQSQMHTLELAVQERTKALSEEIQARRAVEIALRENQAALQYQAHHDALTGLPNRLMLKDRLSQSIAMAKRRQEHVAVLWLDLDHFKVVNDSYGHQVGDGLLMALAERLRATVRTSDTVSRLGGDEFVVLMPGIGHAADATVAAKKVLAAFEAPFVVGGHSLHASTSVGVSLFPEDGDTTDKLLMHADTAMYRAKSEGRNAYHFYSDDMSQQAQARESMGRALRVALDEQQFELHYQPKLDIEHGIVTGVEALIRWRHPEWGMVPPLKFIPVAEETGLIEPIGEWVLQTACAQAQAWQQAWGAQLSVAVNVSARQFRLQNFPATLAHILANTGLSPQLLELELTESLLMQQTDVVIKALNRIHQMGVSLALDDFGTGFSSLSYLRRFPIDVLKIDRSFVSGVDTNQADAAITRAIISMAHSLGLSVVAEGVETQAQLAFLIDQQCDRAQGYLLGRPQSADAFAQFWRARGGHLDAPAPASEAQAAGVA